MAIRNGVAYSDSSAVDTSTANSSSANISGGVAYSNPSAVPNPTIDTSQPNPSSTQVTPAAATVTGTLNSDGTYTVNGTKYTSPEVAKQNVPGLDIGTASSGQTIQQQTQTANQALQPTMQSALQQAQASGPAPQTAGEANQQVQSALAPVKAAQEKLSSVNNINQQLSNDPGYQQLLADANLAKNTLTQQTSLVDTYKQLEAEAGLPALNTQLLNAEKIINGTEDDIRNEVQAASGFATNSQVMALASARNKTLIQNYNNLLAAKANAENHINTMLNLAGQDRANAIAAANQQLNIDAQLQDYRQKFISNAQAAYKNVIDAVGYKGLYDSLSNDPNALSLAEQTLGFAPGQLKQIVESQQAQTNLKNLANYTVTTPYVITAAGEVQNSQTGESYTSPQDFQAKTGMTLDQAGQKGMIKPLGLTSAQEQQKFENQIKSEELNINKAQLGVSQYNAQTARINATQPSQSIVDTGSGKSLVTYDKQGNIINQQTIKSNTAPAGPEQLAAAQGNIQLGNDLIQKLSNPTAVGVGSNALARNFLFNPFSSKKADFIAGVKQLTSQLTLDSLIKAKAAGATFGALSEGELGILAGSATKLNSWAIPGKNPGEIIGYNTSASSFRNEIDKINNFAKLDYVLKGGNPDDVGVNVHADGTAWTKNSNGSVTQIYP